MRVSKKTNVSKNTPEVNPKKIVVAGMNRVFSYEKQEPNPLLPDKKWAYKKLQKESN